MTLLRRVLAVSMVTGLTFLLPLPSTASATIAYVAGTAQCTTKSTVNANVKHPALGGDSAWFTVRPPATAFAMPASPHDAMVNDFTWGPIVVQPQDKPSNPKAWPALPASIGAGNDVLAVSSCS